LPLSIKGVLVEKSGRKGSKKFGSKGKGTFKIHPEMVVGKVWPAYFARIGICRIFSVLWVGQISLRGFGLSGVEILLFSSHKKIRKFSYIRFLWKFRSDEKYLPFLFA
jgi:hypothetical protein